MVFQYTIGSHKLFFIPFYSEINPEDLLKLLKEDLDDNFTVLNGNNAYTPKQIFLAYIMAKRAFSRKKNISKSLGIEILLYLSKTRQINDAIRTVGYKGGHGIIVAWNVKDIDTIVERLKEHVKITDKPIDKGIDKKILNLGYKENIVERYKKANLLELLLMEEVNLLDVKY